ncbi:MAG: dehydrogenase conserved domain protein, nuoe and nuof [Firmicutes bacterium]|nr:dehydrogenase conserved domain protein, nuoe and nuof [Bacillota bacterium]
MTEKLAAWEKLSRNDKLLINMLHLIQEEQGYISRNRLAELAEKAEVPVSQLQGLVSFFNSFRTYPAGKHRISVCYGTACYAKGAPLINDRLVDELKLKDNIDTSSDGLVTLEHVYCVGACSRAPLIVVDGEISGKIKSHQVPLILESLRRKE